MPIVEFNIELGSRQRLWAKQARAAIVAELGGKCAQCGTRGTRKNPLELDCKKPQGDDHHRRMDSSARVSFYRKQRAQGNLQVLCKKHHGAKSAREVLARYRSIQ